MLNLPLMHVMVTPSARVFCAGAAVIGEALLFVGVNELAKVEDVGLGCGKAEAATLGAGNGVS